MKRRDFLKRVPLVTAPLMLNNIPLKVFGQTNALQKIAGTLEEDNDKVLVLIQLHGGNDGLNMMVPVDNYSDYYNLRPNIAIPTMGSRGYINLDPSLDVANQVGLHPDMTAAKEMYDEGNAAFVQAVAYDNINGSHFRSRDIWFMGGDYDDYLGSGWMGRYLDHLYPNYPDAYPTTDMPDPLGLEIGNSVSLAFHRAEGIPTAISLQNPEQFHDLITNVGVNPPESVEDTYYGQELQWIMGIEASANKYADRLLEVYNAGSNDPGVIYPETYHQPVTIDRFKRNGLSGQLKVVSRLLSGGSKTKIFLCRIGGFDTHALQVEAFNPSYGAHATLLYYITSAVKAFMGDIKAQGMADRVVAMTFSEFGRRAASNGSYGTDHGTAAPMMLFGAPVKGGIIGTNPDLTNLDGGNLRHQFDYRQVFTSVLEDHMCASPEAIQHTLFSDFSSQKLDLIDGPVGIHDAIPETKVDLLGSYPNPAQDRTTITYAIRRATEVEITLHEANGRQIRVLASQHQMPGKYDVPVDLSDLPKGNYVYQIRSKFGKHGKQLIKL